MSKPASSPDQQQIPAPTYQPQYGQQPPPVMVYQRNDALIAQYQKEITDNQLGCSDQHDLSVFPGKQRLSEEENIKIYWQEHGQ
ncbi:hypothetical protein BG006_002670 [Podila minutissima]|uniref:Uncharacterized protein n=1 Tax=Podila minutissima TaxID=64525 RepID=A0A9P5SBM6_9FUNG|nr:hypothetical protein BG006_002670 [Podila minutissima]